MAATTSSEKTDPHQRRGTQTKAPMHTRDGLKVLSTLWYQRARHSNECLPRAGTTLEECVSAKVCEVA